MCASKNNNHEISILSQRATSYGTGTDCSIFKENKDKGGLVVFGGPGYNSKYMAELLRYMLNNKTSFPAITITHEYPIEVAYDSICKKATHSKPDNVVVSRKRDKPYVVMLGYLKDENMVDAAIDLSLDGTIVVGYAACHDGLSSTLLKLVTRFPCGLQLQKLCELLGVLEVLVAYEERAVANDSKQPVFKCLFITDALRKHLLETAAKANNVGDVIKELDSIISMDH